MNNATLEVNRSDNVTVANNKSGSGALVKSGPGRLNLTGNLTHTGPTQVTSGRPLVNGTKTSTPVTVSPLAALGGRGKIQGPPLRIKPLGRLGSGNSPGLLETPDLELESGAVLEVELDGTTVDTGYDQVKVIGAVNLNTDSGTGAVLTVTLGFGAAVGDQFVNVDNDGSDPILGTFEGLPEGKLFASGGATFRITYLGGDGNDIVLTRLGL